MKLRQDKPSPRTGVDLQAILGGAAVGLLGKAIGAALQLGFIVSLTQCLGPAATGVFFLGFAVSQITSTLSGFSLDVAGRRYCQNVADIAALSKLLGRILVISSAATYIVIASATWLVPPLMPKGLSSLSLVPFLISGLVVGQIALQTGIFQGLRMIVPSTLIGEVLYPGIRLLLFWVLIAMNLGAVSAVAALVLSGAISAVVGANWLYSRVSTYKAEIVGPLPAMSEVSRYVGPMVIARLINLAIVAGMPLLIGQFGSVEDVAEFGAASRLTMLVNVVIISVSAMFSPMISAYLMEKRMVDLETLYQQVAAFTFLVVSPVISICVLFPSEVMSLFGANFHAGAQYLRPLAIGQLVIVSLAAADQVALMHGSSRLLMITTSLGTALAIGLALTLQPVIGPVAFGLATAIGLAGAHFMVFLVVYRKFGLHPFGRDMILANLVTWFAVAIGIADVSAATRLAVLSIELVLVLGIGTRLLVAAGILAGVRRRLGLGRAES